MLIHSIGPKYVPNPSLRACDIDATGFRAGWLAVLAALPGPVSELNTVLEQGTESYHRGAIAAIAYQFGRLDATAVKLGLIK